MKKILVLCSALALLSACGDDDGGTPDPGGSDSGTAMIDAGTGDTDAGAGDTDASTGDTDASTGDTDAGAPVECFVNADCPDDQRCECSEEDGCFCAVGVRGTGRNGIDTCTDGNDCASSLCVEGPEETGEYYCSDVCESNDDCTGRLPRCILGIGICARDPG